MVKLPVDARGVCLILSISTAPDEDASAQNYLVVLDYYHKKSYLEPTNLGARCYKNGKIVANYDENLWIAPPDSEGELSFVRNRNSDLELEVQHRILLGKWIEIGTAYLYLKYDSVSQQMEPVKASVIFDKFSEGKLGQSSD